MSLNSKAKQTLQQGYEKFVVKNAEGCWGWSGCRPKNPGYGEFRYGMKTERAHRASWIIHFGEIPKNKFVLHKCDNRECSNPSHLFLGTNLDNINDMLIKKRNRNGITCGEKNHFSKLKIEQVKEIKNHLLNKMKLIDIAKIYHVTPACIGKIKNNHVWRAV